MRAFGGIVILKQRGDVRQIGTPELRDQRLVLVGKDEDAAGKEGDVIAVSDTDII